MNKHQWITVRELKGRDPQSRLSFVSQTLPVFAELCQNQPGRLQELYARVQHRCGVLNRHNSLETWAQRLSPPPTGEPPATMGELADRALEGLREGAERNELASTLQDLLARGVVTGVVPVLLSAGFSMVVFSEAYSAAALLWVSTLGALLAALTSGVVFVGAQGGSRFEKGDWLASQLLAVVAVSLTFLSGVLALPTLPRSAVLPLWEQPSHFLKALLLVLAEWDVWLKLVVLTLALGQAFRPLLVYARGRPWVIANRRANALLKVSFVSLSAAGLVFGLALLYRYAWAHFQRLDPELLRQAQEYEKSLIDFPEGPDIVRYLQGARGWALPEEIAAHQSLAAHHLLRGEELWRRQNWWENPGFAVWLSRIQIRPETNLDPTPASLDHLIQFLVRVGFRQEHRAAYLSDLLLPLVVKERTFSPETLDLLRQYVAYRRAAARDRSLKHRLFLRVLEYDKSKANHGVLTRATRCRALNRTWEELQKPRDWNDEWYLPEDVSLSDYPLTLAFELASRYQDCQDYRNAATLLLIVESRTVAAQTGAIPLKLEEFSSETQELITPDILQDLPERLEALQQRPFYNKYAALRPWRRPITPPMLETKPFPKS